jgi:hypothetical protein
LGIELGVGLADTFKISSFCPAISWVSQKCVMLSCKFPYSRCCWSLVTTPCQSLLAHFQNFFFPLSCPVAFVCYSCPGLGVSSAGRWQSTVNGNNNG